MDRFWNKVEKTEGCWNWIAAKSLKGHGRFRIDGKLYSPHRLVYEWEHGEIPEGMLVCHHCDNPSCVRLDHLFLGTSSDNMKDAYDKGRLSHWKGIRAYGEQHGHSKMTNETVRQLRKDRKIKNTSYRKLGKKYGITYTAVRKIVKRITWKNVE